MWYAKRPEKPYQLIEIKKTEKISFEQLSNCNADSDCILVSHKGCGGTIKISINKKYESLYNSTPKFQDSTGEICKTLGISYDEQKQVVEGQVPTESLCVSNKCVPKYLSNVTANWKTYRNEEYEFEIRYPSEWEAFTHQQLEEVKETTKRIGGVIDSVEFSPEGKVYKTTEVCGRDVCSLHAIGIYVHIKESLNQYLNAIPKDKKGEILINNTPMTEVKGYKSYLTEEEA